MLVVHRAERADRLVAGLAELLGTPLDDPFTPEVVAVPSRGVERWISQRLAVSLGATAVEGGVCANVSFPSPARVVADALARATGLDPADDPWTERRLAWSVLRVVDEVAGSDGFETLGRHLGVVPGDAGDADDPRRGRRMAVAQKLAGLFASYAAQRPVMLRDWAAGADTDGGGPLDADLRWQAELWRRLRELVGLPSPAERLDGACARLRGEPGLVGLPGRLSLFGPTRLSTDQLLVLDALGEARDVHLWLPHPSPALWEAVSGRLGERRGDRAPARRGDPTAEAARHPLLASLGRDSREMQLRLAATTHVSVDEHLAVAPGPAAETLLGGLQRDLRDNRPSRPPDRAPDPADRSVQVHSCHGRQRQVEVLREVVLGLLQDDPTLDLRDIVVMCPDIEAFAPLVSACFGGLDPLGEAAAGDGGDGSAAVHPGHRLRVRLADRSLRQTNPVLALVARLLELADARVTASEVLDLAAMPPVRLRFGFDDDALERVGGWVRGAGVRWGLDAAARAPYRLDRVRQNTWEAGLDRILVGVAMDSADLRGVGLALPLDDVDSNDIDLAGRLAELVDRLAAAVAGLRADRPLEEWVAALEAALDDLALTAPYDAWQLTQARAELAGAVAAAAGAPGARLSLADLRSLLADRLAGRPTRANFRTGHLTVCSMVPMRSVPHRVVVLLGLDDLVFPRSTRTDGDDVLARDPWVGERDSRSEDRQLFLDAILAARERLVLLYTGHDQRTGAHRPPAVPLGELVDVLTGAAPAAARQRLREQVVTHHPLQSFDPRNYAAEAPFSFDRAGLGGGRAQLGERSAQAPFLAAPLAGAGPLGEVGLDDLTRFFEHPVREFLRQRLELRLPYEDDEAPDALPVALDQLELWAVGDRLLRARLAGADRDTAVRAERLRGGIPPGALGDAVLGPVADDVDALVAAAAPVRIGEPAQHDVVVDLDAGGTCTVTGTVTGVYDDTVLRVEYSRLGPKHRLRAWIAYLALTAGRPDRTWSALTVGRARGGVSTSRFRGLSPDAARAELRSLAELYAAGMREPLPVPPRTAEAYAARRRGGSGSHAATQAAREAWRRRYDGREIGEFDDPAHVLVWGRAHLDVLLTPAGPDDRGVAPHEEHRLGALAWRVWGPLLDAEAPR